MKKTDQSVPVKAKKIKMLLLDVDGVMTDGSIILDNQGNETKAFNVRDGHGIKMAQKAGILIGIITGRSSEVVSIRARELGIAEVRQGISDKISVYYDLLAKHNLRDEDVCFIGDDTVDLEILKRVGLAATVADCHPSIEDHVDLITRAPGGRGAVREVIDIILKHRGTAQTS